MTDGNFVCKDKKLEAIFSINIAPSKTSQLENDSGYITQNVLSDYATKHELSAVSAEIPTKTSELTNDSDFVNETELAGFNYATKGYVDTSIDNIDLSGYATKQELNTKQDKLIAGQGISISDDNVISNTQTSAEWGNIQGILSNQTDLSNELQNIREVAEGKTNSYVVSYADNPSFNTQADSFQLDGTFTDINGVERNVSDLKLGDNIYVQEIDVPDRWCSKPQGTTITEVTLYKLETSKVAIPTKVSELENDSGYITNILTSDVPNNSNNNQVATTKWVNSKISNTETWTFTLADGTEVIKTIILGA